MTDTGLVDLRSDTVTRPSPQMRKAMAEAEVGDDVFGGDPTVNRLQENVASLLGKEAAIYVPSGTMANETAIRAQTQPGDEIIAHADSHTYHYESAAPAALSGCSLNLLSGERGLFHAGDVRAAVRPADSHYPRSALVVVENTHNRGGGSIWPVDRIGAIREVADEFGLRMHLDGARLMNACVATGRSPTEYTQYFDTVSICFSKGLGAPVGSMLCGSDDFIAEDLEGMNLDGLDLTGASFRQARFIKASCHITCFSSACLVNSNFTNAFLNGAIFSKANMEGAHLGNADLSYANLMDANLVNAKLGGTNLSNASLMRSDLKHCHLVRVILSGANLKQADMERAFLKDIHLRGCCFERACLEDAHFGNADLSNADFFMATLINTSFQDSNLEETSFRNSDIRSAYFNNCKINSKTKFIKCPIDKKTNFNETNISMAYCDSSTKQLLSYNLRKRNWDSWCRRHKFSRSFVKLFWWFSNYGLSSRRIFFVFMLLACVFAAVYFACAILFPPGIVANLVTNETGDIIPIHLIGIRSFYFSVVTMTTLGFGDMYALPNSMCGHLLLTLQVVLGYVLLGALITRFAILFTGDGPAGSHMKNYVKGKCSRIFFDGKKPGE